MNDSPMNVSSGGNAERQPIPVGNYNARCVVVAGVGPHETPYGEKNEVVLCFDIPEIVKEWTDDQGNECSGPARISGFFNLTLGTESKPSKLRTLLEGWRGRPFTAEEEQGFHLSKLVDKCLSVTVQHRTSKGTGKLYDFIASATPLKQGDEVPPASMEPVYFDWWNYEADAFAKLPGWLQNKVAPLPGDTGYDAAEPASEQEAEDDIPF